MATDLLSPYLLKLDQVWHSVRLQTKSKQIPVDADVIIGALEQCKLAISTGTVRASEDEKTFDLLAPNLPRRDRIEITVAKAGTISVGLGKTHEKPFRDDIYKKIFPILLKELQLEECALSFVDKLYKIDGKTEKNPEQGFVSLLSGSLLGEVCTSPETYNFQPNLSLILDKENKIVCSLQLYSDISFDELIAESTEQQHKFTVYCGIANIDNYCKTAEELLALMESHKELARNFLDTKIIPSIIIPLMQNLFDE